MNRWNETLSNIFTVEIWAAVDCLKYSRKHRIENPKGPGIFSLVCLRFSPSSALIAGWPLATAGWHSSEVLYQPVQKASPQFNTLNVSFLHSIYLKPDTSHVYISRKDHSAALRKCWLWNRTTVKAVIKGFPLIFVHLGTWTKMSKTNNYCRTVYSMILRY